MLRSSGLCVCDATAPFYAQNTQNRLISHGGCLVRQRLAQKDRNTISWCHLGHPKKSFCFYPCPFVLQRAIIIATRLLFLILFFMPGIKRMNLSDTYDDGGLRRLPLLTLITWELKSTEVLVAVFCYSIRAKNYDVMT